MTPRPARALSTAAAVLALAASSCTPPGSADPTTLPSASTSTSSDTATPSTTPPPTAAPSPTLTPTPTATDSPAPKSDELVDLVTAYRNILLDLPELPLDEARAHVTDRAGELTTPDGNARERLDGAPNSDLVDRGRPFTAILGDPQPDGQDWTTTACTAERSRTTEVATGDPTDADPITTGYIEIGVRVTPDDNGGWLLADYTRPPIEEITDCIPPDDAEAIRANWKRVNELTRAWAAAGQPEEELGPLRSLLTRTRYRELADIAESRTVEGDLSIDVDYGLTFQLAAPDRVTARWCVDPSLDPTLRSIDNETGEVTNLADQRPTILRAEWVRADDGWRQGEILGARAAFEGDAPCEL